MPTLREGLCRSLLIPAVIALLATTGLAGSRAAAAPTGAIVDVVPHAYEVVQSGSTRLSAALTESTAAGDVDLLVDGRSVGTLAFTGGRIDTVVTLEPGPHDLRLEARLDDGSTATRAWSVAAADVAVTRIAGPTRVDTAAAVAGADPTPGRATAAVIVRADGFADGLAGGPLAATLAAPLLLSASERLSPVTAGALDAQVEPGSEVLLIGGTAALSSAIERDLAGRGWKVRRLSGRDRYATAALIAAELPASDRAFVVSGQTFPDALAASGVASRDGIPVLLTERGRLPTATRTALQDRRVSDVTVAGGTVAVSNAVVEDIRDNGARRVARVAGQDRYETATMIAATFLPSATTAVLANGLSFPDALAGGPHAAALGAPILLTAPDALPAATRAWLQTGTTTDVRILGGFVAVDPAVEQAIRPLVADGPAAASMTGVAPTATAVEPRERTTVLTLDRAPDAVAGQVLVGGHEVAGEFALDGQDITVEMPSGDPFRHAGLGPLVVDVLLQTTTAGVVSHPRARWTLDVRDPVYALADGIQLYEPSTSIDMIGFHQANHDGARGQEPTDNGVTYVTMESRGRGTQLTSAADIVSQPGVQITSPTTGTVIRGGSYTLYCKYTDNFLVIEPDGFPGYEVKLLHFKDLAVATGDHLVAGVTRIGSGPRQLPFESQVDEISSTAWPHVHIEVVDTRIPDKPNGGSGGC